MRKLIRFGLYFLMILWGLQALNVKIPQGFPQCDMTPAVPAGDTGFTTLE